MFKKYLVILISIIILFSVFSKPAFAIQDPLAVPNNKIGIHILTESELEKAAKLVNTNNGDWGYVTMPIQAGDKNIEKWQKFMDDCKRLRIIPILRLATEGDYFNTAVWRKPLPSDLVDFANFLESLDWPTENRYVIIFNEVNRGDEWGGAADPAEYAELLSFAVTVFKSKSPNFFIISAGLDNAAPSQGTKYMNQYAYMRAMNAAVPGIYNQVDGLSSHSYPNPGFSQPPNTTSMMGTGSFIHERALAQNLSGKKLPVFITETGWAADVVSDDARYSYYQHALANVWNDSSIVAITPFLLEAGAGPFEKFSFTSPNGELTKQYQLIRDLPKVRGAPVQSVRVLSARAEKTTQDNYLPVKDFSHRTKEPPKPFTVSEIAQTGFEWLMGLDR